MEELREELRKELKITFCEFLVISDERILNNQIDLLLEKWDSTLYRIKKMINNESLNEFITECFYKRAIECIKVKPGVAQYFSLDMNRKSLSYKLMNVDDDQDKSKLKLVIYILNNYYKKMEVDV